MKSLKSQILSLFVVCVLLLSQTSVLAYEIIPIPSPSRPGTSTTTPQTPSVTKDYDELHAHTGDLGIEDGYSYRLEVSADSTGYNYVYTSIEDEFENNFTYNNYVDDENFEIFTSKDIPEELLVNKNLSMLIYIKTDQVFIQDAVARTNNEEELDPLDNDRFGAYFSTLDKNKNREFADTFVSGTKDWTLARINVNPLNYFYPYNDGSGKGELILNPVLHLGNKSNLVIGTAWYDLSLIQLTENEPIVSNESEYGFYKEQADLYIQSKIINSIILNYTVEEKYDNNPNYSITFEENNNENVFYLDLIDEPETNYLTISYKEDIPAQNAVSSVTLNIKDNQTEEIVFTDIIFINIYDTLITELTVSPQEVHLDLTTDETEYHYQQLLVNPPGPDVVFTSLDPSVAIVGNHSDTESGLLPGQIQAVGAGITQIEVTLGHLTQTVTVYVNQSDVAINTSEKDQIEQAYNDYLSDIVDDDSDKVFQVKRSDDTEKNSEISLLSISSSQEKKDKEIAYKVVNFIRVVSGLKPITPNLTYESYAEAGLRFLAKSNLPISHTAARNSGNNLANIGLSNSNLTSRTGAANVYYDPNEMIYNFLIDTGNNNLYKAGHRRWLLNDTCAQMGFAEEQSADTKTTYGALYVLNDNGAEANVTTFPSAGDFPIEMVSDFYNGNFTWSVMFGDKYKLDTTKDIAVKIRRASDGKTVNYKKVNENQVNANTDWFSIVPEIVGNGQGININPASFINNNVHNLLGDTFEVTISGPGIKGVSSSLSYKVHFYSMKGDSGKAINATGLVIDQKNVVLAKGENTKLTATLTPKNATNELKWSSRNPSIVSVNENGVITGVGTGTAQILVQTDNKLSAMVTVTVNSSSETVRATGLKIDPNSFTMKKGDTRPLVTVLTPENSNDPVIWTSENPSIATVDELGRVTAKGVGTTNIVGETRQSKVKAKALVTVVETKNQVSATGVKLATPYPLVTSSNTKPTIGVGQSVQLTYTLTPTNATDTVIWSVGDTKIAKVSTLGILTGVKAGNTTVKVRTQSGKTDTFNLTVTNSNTTSGKVYVTNIDAGIKTLALRPGKTYQLKTTITPSNATDKSLTYRMVNTNIATVSSSGLVKGVKAGTTALFIESKDGGATTEIEVVVSANASTDATKAPGEIEELPGDETSDSNNEGNNIEESNTPDSEIAESLENTTTPGNSDYEEMDSSLVETAEVVTTQDNKNNETVTTQTSVTTTENPKTGLTENFMFVWFIVLIISAVVTLIFVKRIGYHKN